MTFYLVSQPSIFAMSNTLGPAARKLLSFGARLPHCVSNIIFFPSRDHGESVAGDRCAAEHHNRRRDRIKLRLEIMRGGPIQFWRSDSGEPRIDAARRTADVPQQCGGRDRTFFFF